MREEGLWIGIVLMRGLLGVGSFLSLEFVDGYDGELRTMNRGKVGRPYVLTERYAEFLSVVRYLFGFPYGQLGGFTS